jgi:hypothetical protein
MLVTSALSAQGQEQVRSTASMGGNWSSGGNYTSFNVAGQYAVTTSFIGGDYTGSIGFMMQQTAASVPNLAPVAISPSIVFSYELGSLLYIEGFDPESAPIEFVIVRQPAFGTLSQPDTLIDNEFIFDPNADLQPDVVYSDTIQFQVDEVEGTLSSEIATVIFEFGVEDKAHTITGFDVAVNSFTLSITDTLFNEAYFLDINYYNISDPANAVFVNINNAELAKGDLSIAGIVGDFSFDVNQTDHAYLFEEDQVLITVLVTTANGYSSFNSYVIDNRSGGRIQASEDGQFFAIGSEMSVPENKTVLVKMMAIDFADFDVSLASFEWISTPRRGTIDKVSLVKSSPSLNIWEAKYASTEEIGGKDSIQFRVFNPSRNTYDSGYVKLSISAVNDLPTLVAISDQQMDEDGTFALNLSFDDPDNELAVFANSNEASNLETSIIGNVLTLTGKNDFNGLVNINVWVEEVGTAEKYLRLESFGLEVRPVNDPPIMVQVGRLMEAEDVTITVPLSASDQDTELQVFSFNGYVDDPSLASIEIIGSTLKVIPNKDAFGVTTVHVTVNDGGTSSSSTSEMSFEVEFTPVNDAPMIVKTMETQVLAEGFPSYDINLGGFFSDPETASDQLAYSISANSLVSASFVNSMATVSTLGSGTSDVTFVASDGEFSTEMIVTFVVNAQSANLVVANMVGEISLSEDFANYTIDVSNVFSDINNANAVFQYSVIGNSFIGVEVDNANAKVTFRSQLNYAGTESVILIGTSGGQSMFVPFDLVINAVNDAPILDKIESQSISEDGILENLLITSSDIDCDR